MKNTRFRFVDILIGFVFCFTVLFFAPSNIYINNLEEFWFTPNLLYKYITICTFLAFICFSVFALIGEKYFRKVKDIIMVICFCLTIGFYIQGNFIPDTNGPLDGTVIDWKRINIDMILSDLWWLIIIVFIIYICKKGVVEKLLSKLTVPLLCMLLLEIVSMGATLVSVGGFDFDKGYIATKENEFNYSNQNNMIILMLDRLDGQQFRENVPAEQLEIFDGFTFYSNTMGLFGRTAKALPHALTGVPYLYEQKYEDYLIASYDASPLFQRLVDEDWNIGIYTMEDLPKEGIIENFDNTEHAKLGINSRKRFILEIYQLVAYQYAPYHLKQCFWFYADVLKEQRKVVSDNDTFQWNNSIFYVDNLNVQVTEEKDAFRFYHLEGMHTTTTTAECTESDTMVSKNDSFQGNMLLIQRFLNELKSAGVYDNSIIIIMGDHGDSSENREGMDTGFWGTNPCLLIKGYGESHELINSEKPVSYEDLQSIYLNLLDGKSSLESTLFLEDGIRIRHFYRIDPQEWDAILIEYEGTGSASDFTLLQETGERYYAH